jgi:hypothetical protein
MRKLPFPLDVFRLHAQQEKRSSQWSGQQLTEEKNNGLRREAGMRPPPDIDPK